WLKGEDTGLEQEPMVRAWMQDSVPPSASYEDRPGRWIAEPSWPSVNLTERTFVATDHKLVEDPVHAVPDEPVPLSSPLSVGMFAGKWAAYSAVPDLPYDQREEDGGALVFQSEPLEEPLEIFGLPSFTARVCADQPVAQLAVRLSDVHPSGEAT